MTIAWLSFKARMLWAERQSLCTSWRIRRMTSLGPAYLVYGAFLMLILCITINRMRKKEEPFHRIWDIPMAPIDWVPVSVRQNITRCAGKTTHWSIRRPPRLLSHRSIHVLNSNRILTFNNSLLDKTVDLREILCKTSGAANLDLPSLERSWYTCPRAQKGFNNGTSGRVVIPNLRESWYGLQWPRFDCLISCSRLQ